MSRRKLESTTIMHDGKFGADWVNICLGPNVIAKVQYQGDGSQRDIAERLVRGWNELDILTVERNVLLASHPVMIEGAKRRNLVIEDLIREFVDIRDQLEHTMTPEKLAALLVKINKAIRSARANNGRVSSGNGK